MSLKAREQFLRALVQIRFHKMLNCDGKATGLFLIGAAKYPPGQQNGGLD